VSAITDRQKGHYPAVVVAVSSGKPITVSLQKSAHQVVSRQIPTPCPSAMTCDLHVGDLVTVSENVKNEITGLELQAARSAPWERLLSLLVCAGLLALFAQIVIGKNPAGLILGLDNRYSKSKFQFFVWFAVVIVAFLSTLWLRYIYSSNLLLGAVDIPKNLLLLSGLSAFTLVASKGITQSKVNDAEAKNQLVKTLASAPGAIAVKPLVASAVPGVVAKEAPDNLVLPSGSPQVPAHVVSGADPTSMKTNAMDSSFPSDLALDDLGNPDLGDFQIVLLTLVGAVIYLVQIYNFLGKLPLGATVSLPDLDPTLVGIFGIGQGAYTLKKFASDPTPPSGPNAVQPVPATPPPAPKQAAPQL
jgi:hypothetical protein